MRFGPALLLLSVVGARFAPAAAAGDLADRAAGMLQAAVPHVERSVGVEFSRPPRIRVLSAEAALPVLEEDLRHEIERRYPQATTGQRRTLLRALARASVVSAVARYSVTGQCLILVPESAAAQAGAHGLTGPAAEEFLLAAIAHELVHALDDQEFDLAALYRGAADREALRAVSMVIEGRAVHFGAAAAKDLGVGDAIRNILPGGAQPRDRRDFTFRLTYEQGARFTAELLSRGGRELAARAMRTPPTRTSFLFHPARWPEGGVDPRPDRVLRKAFPDAVPEPLCELELRARYADLDGPDEAAQLLGGLTGGSQVLWKDTNLAVLAFATEEAAERYLTRSLTEVPAARKGPLVVRAAGPAAKEAVALLEAALDSLRD